MRSARVPCRGRRLRGDLAGGRFTAFYLAGGRLQAAAGFNRPRDVRAATRLIAAGAHPTAAELRDETTDLRQLARAAGEPAGRSGA